MALSGELVGIERLGVYLPERYMTSAELAERTGIPREILEEKFGLRGKHIAREDEHVSDMALRAARAALEGSSAEELDAIIYFGSQHKDYYLWLVSPGLQYQLGARAALCFEVSAASAGLPVVLKLVKELMRGDPSFSRVLIVGASKESQLLDYSNERSRFMFNFADGAAAALITRGNPRGIILESAFVCDGRFNSFVRVPAGGSVLRPSHSTVEGRLHYLDVTDPVALKQALDPVTADNFVNVIKEALRRSGHGVEEVDLLIPLHTKRSLYRNLLARLGLSEDRALYLEEYGHMSAIDGLVGLHLAEQRGLLHKGSLIVLTSAGTGFIWGATVIRWMGP